MCSSDLVCASTRVLTHLLKADIVPILLCKSSLKCVVPLLRKLVEYVKARVPEDAVLMFHQTWAYAPKSNHGGFVNYDRDQMKMYNAIVKTVNQEAPKVGIKLIIPCGTAIQNARTSALGTDLTRDGFHLSFAHGRYIASCTWLEAVLGVNPIGNTYCPEGMTPQECRLAQKAAHKAVNLPT